MLGLLPPSSKVSFFRFPAAAWTISLPTSVEPVNATLSTSSWAARAAPAVSPNPVTTLTTPSGTPASAISSARRSADSGVCSAGLSTTQLPVARAGSELPGRHQQREVPGDDLAHHTDRLPQGVGVEVGARSVRHRDVDGVALDLGGPAGHVVEQVGGQAARRPPVATREGLAVVQRLELGQLVDMLEDQVTDPPDDPAPVGRGHAAHGPSSKARAGGGRRPGRCPRRRPRPRWPASLRWLGFGRLERPARGRVHPSAVDEQLAIGGDEVVDPLVQSDCHGSSSPSPMRRRGRSPRPDRRADRPSRIRHPPNYRRRRDARGPPL